MKVAIDAGHGWGNRGQGFDPGAVSGEEREAEIVLLYAFVLQRALHAHDIPTFLTRTNQLMSTPLTTRASRARHARCTHFVSFHCNSAEVSTAQGCEVFYRTPQSKELAEALVFPIAHALGVRARGVVQRDGLSVLKFGDRDLTKKAVLIELGFLSHAGDRKKLLDRARRELVCETIASVLAKEQPVRGGTQ